MKTVITLEQLRAALKRNEAFEKEGLDRSEELYALRQAIAKRVRGSKRRKWRAMEGDEIPKRGDQYQASNGEWRTLNVSMCRTVNVLGYNYRTRRARGSR